MTTHTNPPLPIGTKVRKTSSKPFKSGDRVGIPVGIETNPKSNKLAFRMSVDDTLVDCHQCKLAE
jgi:hypothetical protein